MHEDVPPQVAAQSQIGRLYRIIGVGVVIGIALLAAIFLSLARIIPRECPEGAIIYGYAGGKFPVAVLCGMIFSTALGGAWLIGNRVWPTHASQSGLFDVRPLVVTVLSGMVLCADLPFLYRDNYCGVAGGLLTRDAPWQAFSAYDWTQLKTVELSCASERSGRNYVWRSEVDLLMQDGRRVTVGGWKEGEVGDRRIARLAYVLRKYPIAYDATRIAPGCNPPELAIFPIH